MHDPGVMYGIAFKEYLEKANLKREHAVAIVSVECPDWDSERVNRWIEASGLYKPRIRSQGANTT